MASLSSSQDHQSECRTPREAPQTPYWNMNIPSHLHTAACPPYLQNLSQKDLVHLSLPDSHYSRLSFQQIIDITSSGRLQVFTRLPSNLRHYRKFVYELKKEYGNVERFVLEQRLGWTPRDLDDGRSRKPFERRSDYKILRNDWPYGVEEGIEHLVVWTKFSLGGEAQGEDTGREAIEKFMGRTFYPHIPRDNVVWFRNWGALKSVHAVEHIHVMLLNPDDGFLKSIVEEPSSIKS